MIITQLCLTIQGEGINTGIPCLLIRLGNCNLICPWCDTKWTNRLRDIESLTQNSSLPFQIESDKEFAMFAELCSNRLSNYKTNSVLITGGEPFLNVVQLIKLINVLHTECKIKHFEIETNGTLFSSKLIEETSDVDSILLNISPKIDPRCYPLKTSTIYDIIEKFTEKYYEIEQTIKNCNNERKVVFKFVYYKEIEENLDLFIERFNISFPIVIMALTPDYSKYVNEFSFLEGYRKSCYDAIDYCIRRNYRFSLREHIWVFNNFKHRNEFEDCKK